LTFWRAAPPSVGSRAAGEHCGGLHLKIVTP
jgi:hypothetical protein